MKERDVIERLREAVVATSGDLDLGAVDRRGRRLRRRRHALKALAVTSAVALPIGVFAIQQAPERARQPVVSPASSSRSPTTPAARKPAFIPPTRTQSGTTVMPVTLPDGRVIELSYPRELALERLRLSMAAWSAQPGCCQSDLDVAPRDGRSPNETFGPVVKTFPGNDGRPVALRQERPSADLEGTHQYLVFEFGRWYVSLLVNDTNPLTDANLALWAKNLHADATENGYLRLRANPPLQLDRFKPGVDGPFRADLTLQAGDRIIEVARGFKCEFGTRPKIEAGQDQSTLSMCSGGYNIQANNLKSNDRAFLERLARSLHIRDGQPAG